MRDGLIKIVFFVVVLLKFTLGYLIWCKHTYRLEVTETIEVDSSNLKRKLLIAIQCSPFKDSVTAVVSNHYKSPLIIVEVVDIKALPTKDAAYFDAIPVMHRWEAGAPTKSAQLFMDENLRLKNKILILTTSWNGLEKTKNADAITGASILGDVPIFTDRIIKKTDRLLK